MPQDTRIDGFLTNLDIQHGPFDLFARFFLKAIHAAQLRGVTLEFGTFEDLMAVNQANLDTWFPMTSSFDPYVGGANEQNGFVLLGRDRHGDVVVTQAIRLFDWRLTTFKEEGESLRFLYDNPEQSKLPNERCKVIAPEAAELSGQVALAGGLWFRPDYRGNKMSAVIPRIGRAYAFAKWNCDCLFAIIKASSLDKKFDKRSGVQDIVRNAVVLSNSASLVDGDLELALMRIKPMQMVDDMVGFLIDFDAEIDTRVHVRRA